MGSNSQSAGSFEAYDSLSRTKAYQQHFSCEKQQTVWEMKLPRNPAILNENNSDFNGMSYLLTDWVNTR